MTAGLQRFISWKPGYLLVGALQIVLAVCFAFSIRIWDIPSTKNRTARIRHRAAPILETLRTPRVLMSMLLFFLYTGIEASLGFWVYSLLTQSRGIPSAIAGFWAGGYWAFFTVGRIAAGFFASRVRIHSIVIGSLCLILAGSIALWWDPSSTISLGAIILIGLAAAPVFPSMVSGTKNRVGTRYASNTVGMQMTAAGLGMAFLPGFAGFLAERFSLEILPGYLTALCLLLIACYSFFMFNEKSWNVRNTPARSLNRKT
jgi:fucose permease